MIIAQEIEIDAASLTQNIAGGLDKVSASDIAAMSMAISLKRIADALDSQTGPSLSIRDAVGDISVKMRNAT